MNTILRVPCYGRALSVRCGTNCTRRYSALPKEALQNYKPGTVLHGYQIEKVTEVPELYLTAIKLSHLQTGAEHLHIARDDTNNVFSVGFRTTPMDNSGVSHILEHTVLCGSQRFPCRDPFFKMLNRSLSTFMNAFTASDYTMYPFSTQNSKDFQNLLSVYLDAVFFPNLNHLDFLQEGWRLEHDSNEDKGSPITFKGVVFNEMKGAMSSPDQLYAVHCQNKLLPSHTYSYNSGGNPNDILNLTHEQLREFHATHYHPSNARFYTYGDLPLESHLEQINSLALDRFHKIEPGTSIPNETRWTEKRSAVVHCPPDVMSPDPDKQTTVSVSYLLPRITEVHESFEMSFLASLLTSGPTSPFYQSLLDANIGAGYSPVCGYDGSTREASFSVGLQGILAEDEEKVKEIIQSTLEKVIKEGFEADRIEAVLHSVELAQKHQTTSFGLGLIMSLMSVWNQDGDPISSMQLDKLVSSFKQKIADNPRYLQDLVQKYLVTNQHQLWLRMTADDNYNTNQEKAEMDKLNTIVQALDKDTKEQIYQAGIELAESQNQEVDVSCLPTVTVGDIHPKTRRTDIKTECLDGSYVQLHEQPTNGVTYFKAVSPLGPADQELVQYLPLFCNVITQMGTKNMSFRELAKEEELRTGGLGVGTHIIQRPEDTTSYEVGVALSSHCLERNLHEMFGLWQDIFQSVTLSDQERLTTLVRMEAAEMANAVSFMGHAYAMRGVASSLSPVGQIGEVTGGMSQVNLMKQIAELDDLSDVVSKLTQLSSVLLNRSNMRFCLNAAPSGMSPAVEALDSFLTKLPGRRGSPVSTLEDAISVTKVEDFSAVSSRRHFQLPFPVNYVSMGMTAVPYKHEDFAKEKGGAYGSGATMSNDGTFKFYSYRDPRSTETLDVFHQSLPWIQSQNFTNQDLDEAKIALFSNVDAPIAPGSRGVSTFLNGVTDDDRQIQRDRLFAVTREDVVDVAQRKTKLPTHNSVVVKWLRQWTCDQRITGSSPGQIIALCLWARHFISIASLHPGV
ncbi:putative presequence protease, mitochondrial [Apostichopus japonicus]|uniref:Presequence protease, mitochondrial n=1 Tax=Stichopus japonicus TaxID=307972 RepID=A0A2G8JNK1_STIJA|nr:putative presequence protease, mitochondrial [Apostichopus japonicus]